MILNSTFKAPIISLKTLLFIASSYFFLLLLTHPVHAQTEPKRILGTFIYEKNVYNYEFRKDDFDNFALFISSLTDTKTPKKETPPNPDSIQTGTSNEPNNKEKVKDTTKVSLSSILADQENSIFHELNQKTFNSVFISQMVQKFGKESATRTDSAKLGNAATQVFYKIQTRLEFLDDEPVTANLILRKDSITSILQAKHAEYYNGELGRMLVKHLVNNVSVETEDGTIKNIKVHLVDPYSSKNIRQSPRSFLIFRNILPISISSKNDPERFADVKLFCINCAGIPGLTRYITLSNLLILDIILENDKDDYSPSNRVVSLAPNAPIVELKKEKRSRIIEVSAFSDFVGLDQEEPNGLIQIEAKRKININTQYKRYRRFHGYKKNQEDIFLKYNFNKVKVEKVEIADVEKSKKNREVFAKSGIKLKDIEPRKNKSPKYDLHAIYSKLNSKDSTSQTTPPNMSSTNTSKSKSDSLLAYTVISNRRFSAPYYGWWGSIEPRLLFSKLEENNRYLYINEKGSENTEIGALDIYQHQLNSFGLNFNIYRAIFPQSKINWNVLDLGMYWYRTRVKELADSASIHSEPLNNSYWSLGTQIGFRPDSRWAFNGGISYMRQQLWNRDYVLDHKNGLWQVGIDGHLKTNKNSDSKLFMRFRWTFEGYDLYRNYTQVQLGYSMNIFANKDVADK